MVLVKVPQVLFYPFCWVEWTPEGFSDAHSKTALRHWIGPQADLHGAEARSESEQRCWPRNCCVNFSNLPERKLLEHHDSHYFPWHSIFLSFQYNSSPSAFRHDKNKKVFVLVMAERSTANISTSLYIIDTSTTSSQQSFTDNQTDDKFENLCRALTLTMSEAIFG